MTHEGAKFESEGFVVVVYLLTCDIMRGKRLELTRMGGMWRGREWEWSGRRGSGQCDCVCVCVYGSRSSVTECCVLCAVHTCGLRASYRNSRRR